MPAPWEKYAETAVAEPGPWNKYSDAGPWTKYEEPARDTSRDSYEAQLEDAGLTEVQATEATRLSDKQAELFAKQQEAKRTGEYWEGVADRIDNLTGVAVEPLTRPLSGAVGRATDAAVNLATGQPQASPGNPGATEQALAAPLINLPRAGEAESGPGKVAAGIYNAGADLLASLSSPDALALLPAAANKTVLTAWISQMAGHQPERVIKATQLFKAGKLQEAVQEVATGVGELGLAELGRRHVMGGERLKAADVEGQPRMMVDELGNVADRPSPDLVARNRAAPGTVRPTEQQAMASPLEGREGPEVFLDRVPILSPAGEVVDVQIRPRIREIVIEEPQVIEPVARFLKPEVEGGKLPERRQGFQRTAEDLIEARPEPEPPKETPQSPGLVSGTAAEAWADRTISAGRERLNTGLDPELFSAYVVKGAAHLERGARKFSDWAQKMIAEHGDPIRPHLRRIFEEAQRGLAKTTVDRDTLKQRKLAARGSVSQDVAPEHRERLKTGRESFYEPQDVGRVEDVVSKMTSEELGSVPLVQADGPQNIGIAAKLETYRRLVAADQLDAAWRVIDETMKLGTSLGQLVNQFKLLRGATPDGVMVMLNRGLKEQGFDAVTPGETMRVRRLAEESIKANAKWKEAERQWKEAPTEENFKRVEELQSDAIAADSILQEKLRLFQPRNLGNTLSTLFKGNLIAPISQARNVVGNTANLALRGGMRSAAVAVDAVDAVLRSRPRTRALVGLRGTKEAAKAVGRALPEAWDVLKKGGADKDLSKAEARVGLRPLVALRDAISADILGPKRDGKTPVSQRLMMLLEGSPMGMHAAAQLRLLGATDKPFREAARARLITEHLKVADINRRAQMRRLARDPSPVAKAELALLKSQDGYTSENVARAVKFPELFIDVKTLERIEHEAATAVFQNKNVASSGIHRALSGASPGVRFLFDTVVPFVTTPANVIGEWLSYNPALAAFNAGRHAVRGDARLSTQAVGKFVVGSMAFLAGQWLYQKGLVSPSLDQSDEQQKARILSGQTMPPSRLNVSGLQRALAGEDATWREGDDTRDILGAGGVLGAVFQTVTDVNRRLEREPEDPSLWKTAEAFGANYALLTAGYGVNQSFLRGTSSLLEGLTDPAKTESWLATYLDGLSAIALPNTLNAISRATRQNKPELRGDSLDERLNNQIKARLSGVQRLAGRPGADADLPLKRDLWGRPIPETPTGSNAYLAHFLDVTKSSRIPTDPVAAHIYSLWRRTADTAVIPTPPDANFSILGKRFDPLTRTQVSRLQELVGEERRGLAERIIDNPRFFTAPAESQIAVLKRIWNMGNTVGSFKFYRENSDTLKSRSGPAGFEQSP